MHCLRATMRNVGFNCRMQNAPLPFPASLEERYKNPRFISAGGAGAVYAAHDERLYKQVAIKLLNINSGEQKLLRFHQEAKAIAKFNHPNIVTALDFGLVDEKIAYLVLDLVGDASLNALIKKREPLPIQKCLGIFRQICSAMAYAHAQGVLHRDLKPGNVLLENSSGLHPIAKVADFGIAKISGNLIFATTGNIYIGTPAYTSPEQFCGDDVDERSDIYSFGCLMFATLAGVAPFVGDNTADLALKHTNDPVPPIEQTYSGEEIPESLQVIIETCLEKDRDNRYSDFSEVEELIGQLLNAYVKSEVQQQKKISTTGSFSRNPYSDASSETPYVLADRGGSKQALVTVSILIVIIGVIVCGVLLGFDTNSKDDGTTSSGVPPTKFTNILGHSNKGYVKDQPKLTETERELPIKVLFETAKYKIEKQDHRTALSFLDRIIEQEPNNSKALKMRSDSRRALLDYQGALDDVNAIDMKPDDDRLLLRRAHLRKDVGDLLGAKADFKSYLKKNPRSAKHYKEYAKLCEFLRQNEEALENYSKSIALDPKDDSAFKGRARIYESLGEDQKAIDDFTSAIALKPDPDYYRARGSLLMMAKQFQGAVDDYTKAIELEGGDPIYYALRASAYDGLGEKELAHRDRIRAQARE